MCFGKYFIFWVFSWSWSHCLDCWYSLVKSISLELCPLLVQPLMNVLYHLIYVYILLNLLLLSLRLHCCSTLGLWKLSSPHRQWLSRDPLLICPVGKVKQPQLLNSPSRIVCLYVTALKLWLGNFASSFLWSLWSTWADQCTKQQIVLLHLRMQ